MQDILRLYRDIDHFFHGKLDLLNVINTLRTKFEDYMMREFHVPDWKCDEEWLTSFAKGLLRKPFREVSLQYIYDQFKREAEREIKEA